jgi:hypothetical protein
MDADEEALTLRIGRVARAHVDLDIALRSLFGTLVFPSPAFYLADGITSTNRLVADCRVMLSKTDIGADLLDAGLDALSAAKVVNEERNRVVHDMWLPEIRLNSETPPRWEVLRPQRFHNASSSVAVVSRDLGSVESVLTTLKRVTHRISGLDSALWMTLPHLANELGDTSRALPLSTWMSLAADEFDLLDDGAFQVAGHEPVRLMVLPDEDDD